MPVDRINTNILLRSASKTRSFDLALPATFGIPDLVEADCLLPLDDLAGELEPAGYRESYLYSLGDRYKGRLYGYQTDGDTYLMFYNRRMLDDPAEAERFEEATGMRLEPAQTWAQLDSMLRFFHRPAQNKFGGALFRTVDYIAWEWWIRLHAKGYFPVDEDMRPQFDSEPGIEALEELLAAGDSLAPGSATNGLVQNWEVFAEGNTFCNIGWGGTQKYVNGPLSKLRGQLAHGLAPGGVLGGEPVCMPYFNWGWSFAVSSASQQPELAVLFALFACSPAPSTLAVAEAGGFFDPFRAEHYESPAVQRTYSPEFLTTHAQSMRQSIPDFYLRSRSEYFDVLRRYLLLCQDGKMKPAEALRVVARAWENITNSSGRDGQVEQWTFLRQHYPQAIAQHLQS